MPKTRRSVLSRSVIMTGTILFALIDVVGIAGGATGGTAVPTTHRITQLTIVGHGLGAGLGMGQWGGFGYATRYHRSYQWILGHYYGGTALTSLSAIVQAPNPLISVLIMENFNVTTNVGYDPVVTSTAPFTITSGMALPATTTTAPTTTTVLPTPTITTSTTTPLTTSTTAAVPTTTVMPTSTTLPATTTSIPPPVPMPVPPTPGSGSVIVPAGEAVDLVLEASGTWNAYVGSSCTGAIQSKTTSAPLATGLVNPTVSPGSLSSPASTALLTLCRHDGVDEPLQGDVQAYNRSGYERTLNIVSMQNYLDGVVPAEESASWGDDGGATGAPQGEDWGFQALEAQAIASRSYVLASAAAGGWLGYADICDNTLCQAYVGSSYATTISSLAVTYTLGAVLVASGAVTVVSAPYSASTGGWTNPGTFPVVRDRGDACVVPGDSLQCNPSHSWETTIPGAAVVRAYRVVGRLLRVRVVKRDGHGAYGGRAVEVLIKGTKGSITVTGDQFAIALNLHSNWFAIAAVRRA